jgi:hypothetical protein
MRSIITSCFLAAAAVTFFGLPSAHADNARFCTFGASGNMDCSYDSAEECRAAASGTSNSESCSINPSYEGTSSTSRRTH